MEQQQDSQPLEIYDMSVNNPLAQRFLEKSAFLRFLVQQVKSQLDPSGAVMGDVSKHNNFISQIERVREELFSEKQEIETNIETFKEKLEELNQRRRHLSQHIMQITREKSSGQIDQDQYHKQKYELEMKRKSLGNQIHILNKNISIYNNLVNTPIAMETFQPVKEEIVVPEELDVENELEQSDSDLLFDSSADGITFMGVLSSDVEKAILEKKKKKLSTQGQESGETHTAKLTIITETGRQYTFSLDPNKTAQIGRSSQNDIQIPSPAVSRNHAQLIYENGDYYVVDLESSNGTFVNEKMVIRRKIEPNDTISIGGTRLIFMA